MCSRCGRDAIIPDGYRCGCSGSGNNGNPVQNGSGSGSGCGCGGSTQPRQGNGLLKTAACGLTSTIFRIVNGVDNLLSGNCGCRR